jgi:hypothetical protein
MNPTTVLSIRMVMNPCYISGRLILLVVDGQHTLEKQPVCTTTGSILDN